MCNGIKSAKQYDVQKIVITVKQLVDGTIESFYVH